MIFANNSSAPWLTHSSPDANKLNGAIATTNTRLNVPQAGYANARHCDG